MDLRANKMKNTHKTGRRNVALQRKKKEALRSSGISRWPRYISGQAASHTHISVGHFFLVTLNSSVFPHFIHFQCCSCFSISWERRDLQPRGLLKSLPALHILILLKLERFPTFNEVSLVRVGKASVGKLMQLILAEP